MVKTADLRNGNDASQLGRLHWPRFRRVLVQREVSPGFLIVRDEGLQVAKQTGLIENDHVVETLPANRADDALHAARCHGDRGADRTS